MNIASIALLSMLTQSAVVEIRKDKIVDTALAARRSLPAHYAINATLQYTAGPAIPRSQTCNVSIWNKGDLLGTDVTKQSSSYDISGIGWREITCRNCERRGYGIRTASGGRETLRYVDFKKLDASFDKLDNWRIDWRGIGMLQDQVETYATKPYATALDLLKSDELATVQARPLSGYECYVISSPPRPGAPLSRKCWLRPDIGMNPVLWEDTIAGADFSRRTEVEYVKSNFNLWFPSIVSYTHIFRGQSIKETLTVSQADFANSPPDRVFELSGLSLDDGQPVALPGIRDPLDHPVWKGDKLDRSYTVKDMNTKADSVVVKQTESPSPVPDSPQRRWPYYVGAGVLTAAAAGLVYFALSSRRLRTR